MRLALYQPEIAPNVGAAIRICACFGVPLEIIEPCGFPLKDRAIKRSALDYGALTVPKYHSSWKTFLAADNIAAGRLVLLTTKADTLVYDLDFQPGDILLVGQESAGVPDEVRTSCDKAVRIPMAAGARSLNMSISAAIALAEASRQLRHSLSLE